MQQVFVLLQHLRRFTTPSMGTSYAAYWINKRCQKFFILRILSVIFPLLGKDVFYFHELERYVIVTLVAQKPADLSLLSFPWLRHCLDPLLMFSDEGLP
jgi:hypothetical protein